MSTTDFDPGGTRAAARKAAALARLAATRGTWAAADAAIAHIHTERAPERPPLFPERPGPRTRPDETTRWARFGRRDTERETAIRAVYVAHFNHTNIYGTDVDPEPYTGIRAEHLALIGH